MKAIKGRGTGAVRKKILIVDDHPITRHGLAELLKHEPDMAVCGEAEGTHQAMALIKTAHPDLVMTDITMNGKSGLELIKDIVALHPELPVLVVSMHDETIYAERVLKAGARGYLMKSEGGAKLLKAVRLILQGKVYLSDKMSANVLDVFSGHRSGTGASALSQLTDREFEVFQLLGQGLATREIGAKLHVSSKTVDTHRLHIKEKLQLRSLPELMKYAVRWGATQEMI